MEVAPTNMSEVFASVKAAAEADAVAKTADMANKIIKKLMHSEEVVDYLVDRTSTWIPPSNALMLSTLWGVFDSKQNHKLSLDDMMQISNNNGGHAADGYALWKQLNPAKEAYISAQSFAKNPFLALSIDSNLPDLKVAVEEARMKKGADVHSTLLGYFTEGDSVNDMSGSYSLLSILA